MLDCVCYGVLCENCSFQMEYTFFFFSPKVYPSICIGCINRAEYVCRQSTGKIEGA